MINTLKKFVIILISIASIAWIDPSYDKTKEGNKLYFSGKYDEAISKYIDAQMDSSEAPVLDFNIADVQYMTKKYDEAIVAYEKVITNTRNIELEAKAHFNIGNSLYRQGKLKEALEMYKQTVELTDELVESNSTDVEAGTLREDAKFNHEFVEKKIKEMLSKQKDRQEKQEEDKDDKEKKEQPEGNGQEQQDQNQGEEKQQDQGEKNEQESGQEKDQNEEKDQEKEDGGDKNQDQQRKSNDSNEGKENSQDQQPMDTQDKPAKLPESGMTEEEATRLLDAIQQNEKNSKINLQLEYSKGSTIDKDW
ncbi:MAG: tetratricopeptide repeat protein [Candidatus Anammoxibacter sp.]